MTDLHLHLGANITGIPYMFAVSTAQGIRRVVEAWLMVYAISTILLPYRSLSGGQTIRGHMNNPAIFPPYWERNASTRHGGCFQALRQNRKAGGDLIHII